MGPKRKRQKTEDGGALVKEEVELEDESDLTDLADEAEESKPSTSKRKRKLKATVLISNPERVKSTHLVGAHISSAGGVENSVENALKIGANCFSFFVRPKMNWTAKAISPESIQAFKSKMEENGYTSSQAVPHAMYLTNLGNPDPMKRQRSVETLIDEMNRCQSLGISYLNFHPGSSVGDCSKQEALENVSTSINKILEATEETTLLVEIMAGAGNIVGGNFQELGSILKGVINKARVGVCIDTCHTFAAGYDLRTKESYEDVMRLFEEQVGMKYLKAVHLNDSKEPFSSHKDRHENIGFGQLGLSTFFYIMNDERFAGIPLILETPGGDDTSMYEVWKREVQALYMLQGLPDDPEKWIEVRDLLDEAVEIKSKGKLRQGEKKEKTKANKAEKEKKARQKKEELEEGMEGEVESSTKAIGKANAKKAKKVAKDEVKEE